ncbi:MAG: hypothetical protein HKK67_03410 [Chlorobiaceae bacterium]|nr:hypothetical protein [Chlorobiaceae bacterium]
MSSVVVIKMYTSKKFPVEGGGAGSGVMSGTSSTAEESDSVAPMAL